MRRFTCTLNLDLVHVWHRLTVDLVAGPEEPGEGEAEHRELPPRHHRPHQETRPQVPAGLQRAEWHCG